MPRVSDLFDVRYGVNLELNALRLDPDGVAFVSRSARNNGVTARVARLRDLEPIPAGTISVAGGGSVMESFLQPEPYYSGRDLYYLTARVPLTDAQKLYYCACLRANRYRYSYGRQANRTLRDINLPDLGSLPAWVGAVNPGQFDGKDAPIVAAPGPDLMDRRWKPFRIGDLFDLHKGKRLTKLNRMPGSVPFIGALDKNNGLVQNVAGVAAHPAGAMTCNYNGNGVAEAFYQPAPFMASDDVNVLYPKFKLTPAIAMFVATMFRAEKYRFSYGRKWHVERMRDSTIWLPTIKAGTPDWEFMEQYISVLPFSSQIDTVA